MNNYLYPEIYLPIIYIVLALSINTLLKKAIDKILSSKMGKVFNDKKRQKTLIKLLQNIMKYVIWFITIIAILNVFGIDTTAFLAGAGVVGLAVGFGAQDLVKDVLAGFFIIFENQYSIGDVVEIGGFKGEVIKIGLKTTRLKSWYGEVKIIANRNVIEIINCSITNSLAIADVSVSYSADIDKIEKILNKLAKKFKKDIEEINGEVTVLGVQALADSSVVFRIVADTKPMEQYGVQRKMLKEIKLEFDKEGIEIPFPQLTIHNKEK